MKVGQISRDEITVAEFLQNKAFLFDAVWKRQKRFVIMQAGLPMAQLVPMRDKSAGVLPAPQIYAGLGALKGVYQDKSPKRIDTILYGSNGVWRGDAKQV